MTDGTGMPDKETTDREEMIRKMQNLSRNLREAAQSLLDLTAQKAPEAHIAAEQAAKDKKAADIATAAGSPIGNDTPAPSKAHFRKPVARRFN